MWHLKRKFLSCFAYMSLVGSLLVLLSFILMDKSPNNAIFDGPELLHAYQYTVSRNKPSSLPVPKPNFATPSMPKFLVKRKKHYFNCAKLFDNDQSEMERVKQYLISHKYNFPLKAENDYIIATEDCDRFKHLRRYPTEPSTETERRFPIAFNILMYDNVEQFERLLRVVYAPQNQYCVHVDKKSSPVVMKAVRSIAGCFDNVFVASKLETVVYASYTRLQADINCMQDHLDRNREWKYLINMASSELPLQSNLQLVQILTLYNGANDIHEVFTGMDAKRFKQKHVTFFDSDRGFIVNTNELKEDPPDQLTITKGNAYNMFSRKFVEFALQDQAARDLLDWSRDTYTPDEHYWATLNNLYSNPALKTPGGHTGNPDKKPFFGRYIGWSGRPLRCKGGYYVHNICVFGVEDLPALRNRSELIANKFRLDHDPVAYTCMEEWLANKTRDHTDISRMHERHYRKIALHALI